MLVIDQWQTLAAGITAFLVIKTAVVLVAGEAALGLSRADAVRVALLLAGGGEFAFVVFKLANDLAIVPEELGKLLTASVIISMSLTPILGEVAEWAGNQLETRGLDKSATCVEVEALTEEEEEMRAASMMAEVPRAQRVFQPAELAEGAVVVCGYGEVGKMICSQLNARNDKKLAAGLPVQPFVCFERDMSLFSEAATNGDNVVFGDGASATVISVTGVANPKAVLVTYSVPLYSDDARCLEAVEQLRVAFPNAEIYTRASSAASAEDLKAAGASKVVVESGAAAANLQSMFEVADEQFGVIKPTMTAAALKRLAAEVDMEPSELELMRELYDTCPVQDEKGNKQLAELRNELMRESEAVIDDKTLANWMGYDEALSKWVSGSAEKTFVGFEDFVRFAAKMKDSLALSS